MFNKLIYVIAFVFVLGLFLSVPANAADPSLQLWYEFEDDTQDSSNYARHGTISGSPEFIPGVIGRAIDLGGADTVTPVGYKGVLGTSAFL